MVDDDAAIALRIPGQLGFEGRLGAGSASWSRNARAAVTTATVVTVNDPSTAPPPPTLWFSSVLETWQG
jgi:hypothetical protein